MTMRQQKLFIRETMNRKYPAVQNAKNKNMLFEVLYICYICLLFGN